MITIKSQEEFDGMVENKVFAVQEDVTIECSITTDAYITCQNLTCMDLNCWNLNGRNLNGQNLTCQNLNCRNLICWDLNCQNLNCRDISFYAVAVAYRTFDCESIKGRRPNSKYLCLDSDVVIIDNKEKEGGK